MHQLDENIKELDKDLDTHHLRLSNNHGDFIHEFVFSKYLAWLQTLINNKLAVHFKFIKENRKNINQIDVEYHNLENDYLEFKARTERDIENMRNIITNLNREIDNLKNK